MSERRRHYDMALWITMVMEQQMGPAGASLGDAFLSGLLFGGTAGRVAPEWLMAVEQEARAAAPLHRLIEGREYTPEERVSELIRDAQRGTLTWSLQAEPDVETYHA